MKLENEIEFIYSLGEDFVTGIFPLEMAYLLYTISKYDVDVIFESGRGVDAYSTRILNTYCNLFGKKFISVDFQPLIFNRNFKSLQKNNKGFSHFLSGNSFDILPYLVRDKYANYKKLVLIDGPKLEMQLKLVEQLMTPQTIMALHNVQRNEGLFFYEDLIENGEELKRLKQFEKEKFIKSDVHGRSLSVSSLGITYPKIDEEYKNIFFSSRGSNLLNYYLIRLRKLPLIYIRQLLYFIKSIFIS
jgi:hypothetical protein